MSAGRRPAPALLLLALLLSACATRAALAPQGGGWLDRPLEAWNRAGAAVPRAPEPTMEMEYNRERCRAVIRPPVSPADRVVAAAGWWLFGSPQSLGDLVAVPAAADWDGMCRPWVYQVFVFARGRYAGTLSPILMYSRTDGAWQGARLESPFHITADFLRYTEADPLCCPSRLSEVAYRIDDRAGGPVLVPLTVLTGLAPR